MSNPWTESGAAASIELTFEGIDIAKRDAVEEAEMASALTGEDRAPPGRARSPRWVDVVVVVVWTSMIAAVFIWGPVAHRLGAVDLNQTLTNVMVMVLSPVILVILVRRLLRPRVPPVSHERFTVRLGPAGFAVSATATPEQTLRLAEIDRFEGGTRLSVRRMDGKLQALAINGGGKHAELAARLNEALRAARG